MDEGDEVRNNFHRMGVDIETAECSELFLGQLADVSDPEEKRKKYAREHIVCKKFESTDIIQLLKKVHVSYFKNN